MKYQQKNAALAEDLKERHPDASPFAMEHAIELEVFLDVSIRTGFSLGVEKANIAVIKGVLLGHEIGRFGLRAHEEKTKAIWEFAPLKEQSHIRQFLGCAN